MASTRVTLHFDFIDPLSYLLALELRDMAGIEVQWRPFELRPPPEPLVAVDDPSIADRWAEGRAVGGGLGIEFGPPRLVPWTRKAHELVMHAGEHDAAEAVRMRVFRAYFLEGRDIGRVDVLVELAVAAGLDRTETKAVLDVDRHEEAVRAQREEALARGVTAPPTLELDGTRLEGFHDGRRLGTLLGT